MVAFPAGLCNSAGLAARTNGATHIMAKRPLVFGLLIAAIFALAGESVLAADTSATLQLRGTVPVTCTVQVVDGGASLDLLAGEANRQVGTVSETCNAGSGYQITLSSANGGQLGGGTGSGQKVAYTVSYGDAAAAGLAQPVTVSRPAAAFGRTQALSISLPAQSRLAAGDYQDSLTVTIAAK